MNKKQEIQQALTAAMKARDEDTKRTLRLLITSIKLAEVEEGGEISEERILSILQKEVKTREDSIEEARRADREDLIKAAEIEMAILDKFLPKQMTPEELSELVKGVIKEVGAESIQDMGKVMKELMPRLAGRASGQDASKAVRDILQK
jgi:uncharacterized protein YqeY